MMAMASERISASSRKCVVSTTARPSRYERSSAQMARRECGSIPLVGSSRKTVDEAPISETARHSLRFWPPESASALVCVFSARVTCSRSVRIAASSSAPRRPLSEPYSRRCCAGVSCAKIVLSCGHTPSDWRIATIAVRIESPSIHASPPSGGMSPVSIEMVVVLPAPFAPSSAVIWPRRISRSRPCTATPLG